MLSLSHDCPRRAPLRAVACLLGLATLAAQVALAPAVAQSADASANMPANAPRGTPATAPAEPAASPATVPAAPAPAPPGATVRSDRTLPIDVQADRMQHDDARKVTTFIGNVLLTRGPLRIRSDRLTINQDGKGGQTVEAQGTPATFRQRRDGTDQVVEGSGRRIDYDSRAEKVTLTGQPRINRFVCDRPSDSITGAVIVYDTRSEMFTVDGQRTRQSDAGGRSRVRLVIQPRNDAAAGPAQSEPEARSRVRGKGPAASDDGCEPGPATRLQPSPSITQPREADPSPAPEPESANAPD